MYEDEIRTIHPGAAILEPAFSTPRATYTAIEAYKKYQTNQSSDPLTVAPLYLRKSQAEEMRDKKREAVPS